MKFEKPIVALSAFAMQDDIERTLNSGAAGYITKPIDFKTFFDRIGKFLEETPGSTAINNPQQRDEDFVLNGTVSQRLKTLFLAELIKKLEILHAIDQSGEFEEKREAIKLIAHGYRGNAAIFGLTQLASQASQLDSAIKENKPTAQVIELTRTLISYLERVNRQNSTNMPLLSLDNV